MPSPRHAITPATATRAASHQSSEISHQAFPRLISLILGPWWLHLFTPPPRSMSTACIIMVTVLNAGTSRERRVSAFEIVVMVDQHMRRRREGPIGEISEPQVSMEES